MAWSASRPARSARGVLRPVLAAAIVATCVLAWRGVDAAAPAPGDSAATDTTATTRDTTARRAPPPPRPAGFQSASWETLATVPEATHPASIFNFGYNRVDGAALTLGGAVVTGEDDLQLLYGMFTYAFASERGLWTVGFHLPVGDKRLFIIEGELYRRTWNWDQWIVGETENTVFGLVAQTDYRDYWGAKGVEGAVTWNPGTDFQLTLSGRSEDQTQLNTEASFAIFKKPDGFRPNPTIDQGQQGIVVGTIRIGPGRLQPGVGANPIALGLLPDREVASNLVVSYSRAGTPLDGDFEYEILSAQIHAKFRPTRTHEGRARLIAASTLSGSLPPQQIMSIGGIGTLRGFDYKSIQGDQSFVANGEYYVLVRKNIYAFGFLDFGDSWYGRDNVPRIHPALDGGLGLRLGQGPIAITAARSLQSADAPILIGVRLGGSF